MSLEGGFDEVERIFLQPSILSFQLRNPRFQLHDLGLQRRNRRFNQPGNLLLRESSWHSPVITDADTKRNTTLGGLAVNAYVRGDVLRARLLDKAADLRDGVGSEGERNEKALGPVIACRLRATFLTAPLAGRSRLRWYRSRGDPILTTRIRG